MSAIAVSPRGKWVLAGLALITIWYLVLRSSRDYANVKDYIHSGTSTVSSPTGPPDDLNAPPPGQGSSPPADAPKIPQTTHIPSFANVIPITAQEDRPLIQYAYAESEYARENLRYFLEHGIHDAADFVFILNGETDAEKLIFPDGKPPKRNAKRDSDLGTLENGLAPNKWSKAEKDRNIAFRTGPAKILAANQHIDLLLHPRSNIKIVRRNNTCFDLGAHAEVLNSFGAGEHWFDMNGPIDPDPTLAMPLRSRYNYFILMNASIRGPFVPPFSNACWSSAYLSRLSNLVKLVGMSFNCNFRRGHVQSMIWATDAIGMNELLKPQAIGVCFSEMGQAMEAEVHTTQFLREQGFEVDVFMQAYHSRDLHAKTDKYERLAMMKATMLKQHPETSQADLATALQAENARLEAEADVKPGRWWVDGCQADTSDFLYGGGYYGTNIHPFENLFLKSHRHIDDNMLQRYTEWADGAGYSSYDVCR